MKKNIALIFLLLIAYTQSQACSCLFEPRTDLERYNQVDVMCIGTIVSVEREQLIKFKVLVDVGIKNCKANDTVVVYTNISGASCGLSVDKGEYWSILAYGTIEGCHANRCSGSHSANKAKLPDYVQKMSAYVHYTGEVSDTFDNGTIGARGKLVKGKAEGAWTYYYKDGHLQAEGKYETGLREGLWKYYEPAQMRIVVDDTIPMKSEKASLVALMQDTAWARYKIVILDSVIIELRKTAEYGDDEYDGEVCYYREGVLRQRKYYRKGKEVVVEKE